MALFRKSPLLSGLLYGLGIWLVMNLLVFPLSNVQSAPFNAVVALVKVIWHILLIGLPIAFITEKHFDGH